VYLIKCVIENVASIKARGGKVTSVNTDGAMSDWHPALRAKLKEVFPGKGILVLTCAAHGVSRFFADAFGTGRVATNSLRGNGLWSADVLEDAISLIKFIMKMRSCARSALPTHTFSRCGSRSSSEWAAHFWCWSGC
jgi:hypothetical protein